MAGGRCGCWLGLVLAVAVWGTHGSGQDWPQDVDHALYRRQNHEGALDILMPDVSPEKHDTYLCYKVPLDQSKSSYIVGFQPKVAKNTAHHILLYGCKVPGSKDKELWNCGEMSGSSIQPTCWEGSNIMYAWAHNAPSLQLPKDVGFKVGGSTNIKYLVMQVHYMDVTKFTKGGATDHSGISLQMTDTPQKYLAGIYLLGVNDGTIPAHSKETKLETACRYRDHIVFHPFAFRTHAHKLGTVVSGYRIRNGIWEEIGKRSPKLPQMFYPVSDKAMTIRYGDILAARCTYKSDLNHDVSIGATGADEMCNFYIMYYTTSRKPLSEDGCWRDDFHWQDVLKNIPKNASSL